MIKSKIPKITVKIKLKSSGFFSNKMHDWQKKNVLMHKTWFMIKIDSDCKSRPLKRVWQVSVVFDDNNILKNTVFFLFFYWHQWLHKEPITSMELFHCSKGSLKEKRKPNGYFINHSQKASWENTKRFFYCITKKIPFLEPLVLRVNFFIFFFPTNKEKI